MEDYILKPFIISTIIAYFSHLSRDIRYLIINRLKSASSKYPCFKAHQYIFFGQSILSIERTQYKLIKIWAHETFALWSSKCSNHVQGLLTFLISGRRRRLLYRSPDVKVRCPGNEVATSSCFHISNNGIKSHI